jgi:hypothetical protein
MERAINELPRPEPARLQPVFVPIRNLGRSFSARGPIECPAGLVVGREEGRLLVAVI